MSKCQDTTTFRCHTFYSGQLDHTYLLMQFSSILLNSPLALTLPSDTSDYYAKPNYQIEHFKPSKVPPNHRE